MRLKVLGSSSSGNCYLLENKEECLILEAGIKFCEIQKAISFDTEKVTGCLISHEHKDHSKYAEKIINAAIDTYMSEGTSKSLGLNSHRIHTVEALRKYEIGKFSVVPFNVNHDAQEPLGFLIKHQEIGNLLFATDTYYIENRFKNLNHIMIECNYDMSILDKNVSSEKVSFTLKNRLIASHMSIDTCIRFLKDNDLSCVSEILLIHLSMQNGNKKTFKERVMSQTGKVTYVASQGLDLEICNDGF